MEEFLRGAVVGDVARTLLLAGGAFLLTLFSGRHWIRWLIKHRIAKRVREDGPQSHQVKTGTPTMGGIMIVPSVVILTVLFNLYERLSMLLPLAVLVSFAILGSFDDFLSLTRTQSRTYGFTVRFKFIWLFIIALLAALALYLPKPYGLENEGLVQIPFVGARNLGYWYIPLATFLILATSNAVNITDGVDSLAAWLLVLAFAAYGAISFVAYPRLRYLSPFCFTMVGACAAFLWYNAHPAQVIMGDLGALSLGATLAVVALISQHWLVLPIIGVIFVAETLSVMSQVGYFKWTKRRFGAGRRLFRMSPLHHHFELGGWSEMQVMQRFVLIGMIGAFVGIALALTTPESQGLPVAPAIPINPLNGNGTDN
jgi:phospho-N-acetylmuramoyl-pentapeptide-transferase